MHIPTIYMFANAVFVRAQGGETVQEGKAFVPEVLFKGEYSPICGHFFWDDNNGATTFCNSLGFKNGKITKTRDVYDVDTMAVGTCKAGEALTECTGGGNAWGDWVLQPACKKGKPVGFTVTCDSPGVSSSGIGDLDVCLCMVAVQV